MTLLSAFSGEMWKDIDGFDSKYQISNTGKVRSFKGHCPEGRLMKLKIDKYGYCCISLWGKTKKYHFTVHRLVAIHFIPNPNCLPQVNHKSGDKKDNNVTNLEWCTVQENITHAVKVLGRKGAWTGKTRPRHLDVKNSKAVHQIDIATGSIIQKFERIGDAAKAIGGDRYKISMVCNGHRQKTHGFKWAFANN